MKTEFERDLHHAWMILEFDEIFEEDYQMRMLEENHPTSLLMVKGQGRDTKSRYQYEIGGKISMEALGEREKWTYSKMKEFMQQLVETVREVNNYLLLLSGYKRKCMGSISYSDRIFCQRNGL